jgi:hypothetical protein
MRIVKETGPYLISKYKKHRNWALTSVLVGILSLGLGLQFSQNISTALGVILLISSFYFIRKAFSYRWGIQGEKAVEKELHVLDDSYSLINDIMMSDSGGNIDHVLLSPKGIFIIETKNYSGEIRCNGDQWTKKVGYRLYEIRSVSKQAKNNAKRLSNLIKENTNRTVYVRPICVFTYPSARLRLYKPTLPILRLKELAEFVEQAPQINSLSDSEIQVISQCILGEHSNNPD